MNDAGLNLHTHGLLLSKHSQYEYGFETEEQEQEDQWEQLVQNVETVVLIWGVQTVLKASRPAESGIKRNVAGAYEQRHCRA